MAVNSKADKTHGHAVRRVQPGIHGGAALRPTPYSLAQPPHAAGSGNPLAGQASKGSGSNPLAGAIGQAGTKALQFRAKKILAPLADPNQAIGD